jgi:hypothetical protein
MIGDTNIPEKKKGEKCFRPTLQKKLKIVWILGIVMVVVVIAAAVAIAGMMALNDYAISTGYADVVANAINTIAVGTVENSASIVAVVSIITIAISFRKISKGRKNNGYTLLTLTLSTIALYVYARIVFWIHALVLVNYSTGLILHDACGGWATMISIVLMFLVWFGIISPTLDSIDECFKDEVKT